MVLLPYVSQLSNVTSQLKDIYGLHVGVQLVMMTVVWTCGIDLPRTCRRVPRLIEISLFYRNIPCMWNNPPRSDICITYVGSYVISLRLRFRRNFLSVLHLNLVSSPIKGILEILNLTTRCIPMDILAWTDCVRSSAGKISYIDIFSSSNLQKY